MAGLRLDGGLSADLARIAGHLAEHDVADLAGRLAEIIDALQVLVRHPLIARRTTAGRRQLVIGRDGRGCVALYRYDEASDEVVVLALRAQREAGFEDR